MSYHLHKVTLAFCIFLLIWFWIAQWWSGLIASSGDVITAVKWNEMINKILPLYSTWWLTGNVWVGDSSPDHKFDVAGNIGLNTSSYINFWDVDGITGYGLRDNAGTIQFKNSAGSWVNIPSSVWAWDDLWNHTASQNIALDTFWLSWDGDDEWISIDTNGNIGIGTLVPWATLDIKATTWTFKLSSSGANDTSLTINWWSWDRDPYIVFQQAGVNKWTLTTDFDSNDDFSFYSYGWTPWTRMLIQEDTGNIGIGNTNPNTKLDINGDFALRLWTDYTTTWNQNNVSFSGDTTSMVRFAGAANGTITWIAWGQNGKFLVLHNASNFNLKLENQSGSSLAANQIITGNNNSGFILQPNQSTFLSYDSTASKWRTIDSSPKRYIYRMITAQTSNLVAPANVTQLITSSLPIWAYRLELRWKFRSAATTTGIWLTLTQQTAVIGDVAVKFQAQATATADQALSIIASWTNITTTGTPIANTDYALMMNGTFNVTTAWTVAIQMRSEIAASLVTLQPGTYLLIEPLN
jgi:hypothetical protein